MSTWITSGLKSNGSCAVIRPVFCNDLLSSGFESGESNHSFIGLCSSHCEKEVIEVTRCYVFEEGSNFSFNGGNYGAGICVRNLIVLQLFVYGDFNGFWDSVAQIGAHGLTVKVEELLPRDIRKVDAGCFFGNIVVDGLASIPSKNGVIVDGFFDFRSAPFLVFVGKVFLEDCFIIEYVLLRKRCLLERSEFSWSVIVRARGLGRSAKSAESAGAYTTQEGAGFQCGTKHFSKK